MNAVVIFTILVGICLIISSFIFSEKLDEKKEEKGEPKVVLNDYELDEDGAAKIKDRVEELTNQYAEDALGEVRRTLSEESNDKIMAISEFSQTVMEDIKKSHGEVVYLYSMLQDKEKNIKDYVGVSARTIVEEEKQDAWVEKDEKPMMEETVAHPVVERGEEKVNQQIEVRLKKQIQELEEEPPMEDVEGQQELDEKKEKILSLTREGKSTIDIARELDMGVGEVQLIVGLYQGEM